MDTLKLKRLADSTYELVADTVEALKAQGHDISVKRIEADGCVLFTHVKADETENDVFYLDNVESIERLQALNANLRTLLVCPNEQGSSIYQGVAHV